MILNKKYRSFILMLIFSSLIFGQENVIIKGFIKTSKGKPVNKANVVVIDTKIGTTSNKKGEFQFKIENNGFFNLEVSHVKYQKISKKLNPETDTVIFIKMENKVLQTHDVEYKDPGSSTTEILPTINAANVALPSGNIEGLLSSVGFGVRQNNELSSGFNVRGGNFDENLIYVNGIEVYRPFLARSGQQEGTKFYKSFNGRKYCFFSRWI